MGERSLSPSSAPGGRLTLRPGALDWVDAEGEIVVLDSARSRYLSLNREGVVLWRVLASGATREELAEELVRTFEVPPRRAATDVEAFVARLAELGLLAEPDD